MHSRLLATLVLFALATTGFAIEQPPEPDNEMQISFEVRVITVPTDTPLAACPMKEGAVAFLTDAQLKAALEAAQGNRRVNVMQAPKVTTFVGQEAVVKVTDTKTFVTGVEAKRVDGVLSVLPKLLTVEAGLTLTLRGTVPADKKFVAANIGYQDTRVEGNDMIPVTTMIKPVFEGGAQGKPIPFTQFLQVPQIETVKIEKADLRIPTGGHVVIAGPEFTQEVREESIKPALANIPILSRMGKKVSYSKVPVRTVLIVSPRLLEEGD